MEDLITKLAGVTFDDCQDNIRCFGNAPELGVYDYDLVREPDNLYDKNAVCVCFGGFKLGYLKTGLAQKISPMLANGKNLMAVFVSLNQSPYHDTVGLTVRITEN